MGIPVPLTLVGRVRSPLTRANAYSDCFPHTFARFGAAQRIYAEESANGSALRRLSKRRPCPQSINRTSIMPKYDLPDADLNALADFLLSLDFSKYHVKTVAREQVLGPAGVR